MFKPQPLPGHITSHHPAHLTSLAEGSEEGSDAVSESEGGLIQDDDPPMPSPAASASLDHFQGSKVVCSSVVAAATTGQSVGKERAAAGTDGMFELDINDNMEQASGLNSFTAKGGRLSQHAAVIKAGMRSDFGRPEAVTKEEEQVAGQGSDHSAAAAAVAAAADGSPVIEHSPAVAGPSDDALQPNSSSAAGQSHQNAQPSQQSLSFAQQSLPDSVPAAALSPVPMLGHVASSAAHPVGSQPKAAAAGRLAGIDLEDVELEDAVARVPSDKAVTGQAATDEWEEVNLARAKELAVDAPTAAIPGDKVVP